MIRIIPKYDKMCKYYIHNLDNTHYHICTYLFTYMYIYIYMHLLHTCIKIRDDLVT